MVLEQSDFETKRIVFLIDTDIQLLNATRFILSHGLRGKSDAIIQMKSQNATHRIKALSDSGIFKNIFSIELDKHTCFERIEILAALVQPSLYMRIKHRIELRDKYDLVFLAFATKTFDFIIFAIGNPVVYGYDDGLGSYVGNPYYDNYKRGYLTCRNIFGRGYIVDTLFLNNPDCFHGNEALCVLPLSSKISSADEMAINRVFSFDPEKTEDYPRCIYLNQAVTDIPNYIENEKELADKMINEFGTDCLVRLHPSEKRRYVYKSYNLDNNNNMWELTCSRQIFDDSVLVGFFSTAQFTPKLIDDIEPYLIFTFHLYNGIEKKKTESYMKYISLFEDHYRNKGRIFVPKSLDDYEYDLKLIKSMVKTQ